jgi:hypothetical protein
MTWVNPKSSVDLTISLANFFLFLPLLPSQSRYVIKKKP